MLLAANEEGSAELPDADEAGFGALLGCEGSDEAGFAASLDAFGNDDVDEADFTALLDAAEAGFAALLGANGRRSCFPNVGTRKAAATITGQVVHSA